MDIKIRRCEIGDAGAICELNKAEMGYDFPKTETEEKLEKLLKSDKDRIFVALFDGVVAGYVHAQDYDLTYAPHMKNIMGIAVRSEYKKKGVGRALLLAIEQWAKESGAQGVRLVSGATRTAAHEFYRRCGFGCEKPQINFKKNV